MSAVSSAIFASYEPHETIESRRRKRVELMQTLEAAFLKNGALGAIEQALDATSPRGCSMLTNYEDW